MAATTNPSVTLGKLPPEQRDAMLRLLESSTFASAPRLRSMLAHLMHAMEEGFSDDVTEQSIGQAVFGRPAGYNASEDNIVRVTIRHLRNRLDDYYSAEGAADPISLVIPKGKYIPFFVVRDLSGAPTSLPKDGDPTSDDLPEPTPPLITPLETASIKQSFRWVWLAAIVIILASFAAGYAIRSATPSPAPASGVLGKLFLPGDNIALVAVDANLQAYRQIFGRQVSLDDYIHRTYAKENLESQDPRLENARRFATGANETNVSSVIIGAAFRQALDGRRLVIKHPHDVSVRDFQNQGNVILLGGPWSDPWGQLFETRFNFRLVPEADNPSSSDVHNLQPAAGENADYRPHMDGNLTVNYVRVAIIRNLDNTGHVILLSATSAESLEAASEYLLSEESSNELLSRFHVTSVNALPPVELLLEAKGLNAAPGNHRILAVRNVP